MNFARLSRISIPFVSVLIAAAQVVAQADTRTSPPTGRRFDVFVTAASEAHSNIEHDQDAQRAFGGAAGAGLLLHNEWRTTRLDLTYEAAYHSYNIETQWSRVSHFAQANLQQRLSKNLRAGFLLEGSLKGSSEDRDLSNNVSLRPELEYRLSANHRLRVRALARGKWLQDDRTRDAASSYVELGGELRHGRAQFEVGTRYEESRARDSRYDYGRWTQDVGVTFATTRSSELELGLRGRLQRYPNREVEDENGDDVLRRDRRWETELTWRSAVGSSAELEIGYEVEGRGSNDPRRSYLAHQLIVAWKRSW